MPTSVFCVPRHGTIRPYSFSDSDTDDHEPKKQLSSKTIKRTGSGDDYVHRAESRGSSNSISRRSSRRSAAAKNAYDLGSDAHLAPLSSIFRTSDSAHEVLDTDGEDMLTLKRANPIYEDTDDEDESDYSFSSPAKRMRSLSDCDDFINASPGTIAHSNSFPLESTARSPLVLTPSKFKHDSQWATSSFNTLETFNNAAPIYWADRLSESDDEDGQFVLPLRSITRTP